MPRSVAVIFILLLSAGLASADPTKKTPTGNAANRTGWFYTNGALRKVEGDKWEESNSKEKFIYREMDRTEKYVELYDKDRKLSFRLYSWGIYCWNKKTEKWHLTRPGRWDDPQKKPLDPARNSTERNQLETTTERQSFPRLGDDFEVLAPASPYYNCIAWSLGMEDRWVWPSGNGQPVQISDFDLLFTHYGFKRSASLNYDKVNGYDKVVLYAKRNELGIPEPTHTAKQLSDGSWSSKLGKLPLIRHLHPNDIDGGTYGEAYAVYTREKSKR